MNRGKQLVAAISNNKETPKYMIDVYEPKTPITELIRLVETREPDKDNDNTEEGSSFIRDRL